jgi:hypothetical protein
MTRDSNVIDARKLADGPYAVNRGFASFALPVAAGRKNNKPFDNTPNERLTLKSRKV